MAYSRAHAQHLFPLCKVYVPLRGVCVWGGGGVRPLSYVHFTKGQVQICQTGTLSLGCTSSDEGCQTSAVHHIGLPMAYCMFCSLPEYHKAMINCSLFVLWYTSCKPDFHESGNVTCLITNKLGRHGLSCYN